MKSRIISTTIIVLASIMMFSSCGGQKKAKEITIPFSSSEYRSDADFFRATASGTSPNMEMARTIANLNARNQLAEQVSVVVKSVTEKYAQQYESGGSYEYNQKLEQDVRLVVNQELKGATVKDYKVLKNPDGTFECWINIEMSKKPIEESVENVISKDKKLAIDFDQHLFRKIFDEEMALEKEKLNR